MILKSSLWYLKGLVKKTNPMSAVAPFLVFSHEDCFSLSEDFQNTQPHWESMAPRRSSFCRFWPGSISYHSCSSLPLRWSQGCWNNCQCWRLKASSAPEEGVNVGRGSPSPVSCPRQHKGIFLYVRCVSHCLWPTLVSWEVLQITPSF